MTLVRVIFPWRFGMQRCSECGQSDEVENLVPVVDVEGRLIGWKHP